MSRYDKWWFFLGGVVLMLSIIGTVQYRTSGQHGLAWFCMTVAIWSALRILNYRR